ncbi:MAG: hypothetical protein RSD57_11880 [Comamonas sp.]
MTDDAQTNQPELLDATTIEAFWQELVYEERNLALMPDQEYVAKANEMLARYAPDLALELERADGSLFKRIVISAHGNAEQFENAMALVRAAPSLPGYKVQAFRNRTLGSDFSMGMDSFELACSDLLVGHYDAGGIVGLELAFEKIIPADMLEHARHMSFIMLDHVLGEWDFAVRVGPVDFVDGFSQGVSGAAPLSVFPAIFDAFQHEEMGRTYRFPKDDEDCWSTFEVRQRDAADDAPADLLSLRVGANAVATRADLPNYLEVKIPVVHAQELDLAKQVQTSLQAAWEQLEQGILTFSRVNGSGELVSGFYVENLDTAMSQVLAAAEQHAEQLDVEISTMFDPSWQEYCALYAAVLPCDGDGDA